VKPEPARPITLSVEEARIVELLLVEPSLRERDLGTPLRDWLSPPATEILRRIVEAGAALDPTEIFDALPQDSRDRVAKALLAGDEIEHPYGNAAQAYDDCLRQLRNRRRREERARLLDAIRAAEAREDDAEVRRLQSLKMTLDRERE
jgi:hypothetical protein